MAIKRVGLTECSNVSNSYDYINRLNNPQRNAQYKPYNFGNSRVKCNDNNCLNGGTCFEARGRIKCVCTEMFGGDICEYKSRTWKYKQSYGKFIYTFIYSEHWRYYINYNGDAYISVHRFQASAFLQVSLIPHHHQ